MWPTFGFLISNQASFYYVYSEYCKWLNILFEYFRILFRNDMWELSFTEILNIDDNRLKACDAVDAVCFCVHNELSPIQFYCV